MSLWDIKNKLYKKGEGEDLAKYDQIDFDVRKSSTDPQKTEFVKKDDIWKENKDELKAEKITAIGIAGIVIAGIISICVLAVGFYYLRKTSFNEARVLVSISGRNDSASGDIVDYEIILNNDNRAALKNSFLRVSYPETFVPENNANFEPGGRMAEIIQLGDIKGREEKKIFFRGRAYSPKGTIMYIKAELFYNPSGFSGQFVSNNQIGLSVTSSPIVLNFLAPQSVISGDAIDYLITYKNEGGESFENVKIGIEYPQGFTFSKSEPNVSEGNNIWYIGHLAAGQEGKIVVRGKIDGMRDEIKSARVYIGEAENNQLVIQNDESTETKIGFSPLTIRQLTNDEENLSINAGDEVRFKIIYKNEGSSGLKDVVITEKIEGDIVDYEKLEGLNFNMENKTITWKTSDIPELKFLEPGREGVIYFNIITKEIIPISNERDKNFIISSIAKIDSPDIQTPIEGNKTISGNKIDIKINSKLVLDVKGFYHNSQIENTGPIPPKVGEETTYTIRWKILNISNDVAETKVEASLPTGVIMTGKIYPEDSKITYNERTNGIIWDVGNLSAGTGIISAAKEVSFQIKVVPAPSQAGKVIDILGPTSISGRDLFTNNNLSASVEKKTSSLVEDANIDSDGYTVIK